MSKLSTTTVRMLATLADEARIERASKIKAQIVGLKADIKRWESEEIQTLSHGRFLMSCISETYEDIEYWKGELKALQ